MMYLYDRNDTCIVGRAATSFAGNIARSGDRLTKRCYVTAYRSASRRRACKFIEFKRLVSIVVSCIVYAQIIIDNRRFPGSKRKIVVNERGRDPNLRDSSEKTTGFFFFFFLLNFRPRKIYRPICFFYLSFCSRVGFARKIVDFFSFFFSSKVFAIFHNLTCPRRTNLLSDTVVTLSFR